MISLIPCATWESELPYINRTRPETKLHDLVIDLTGKSMYGSEEKEEGGQSAPVEKKAERLKRPRRLREGRLTDWTRDRSLDETEKAIFHDGLERERESWRVSRGPLGASKKGRSSENKNDDEKNEP